MKPSIAKLYKIFQLEADRGYDNRAVVGGLDRILNSWEGEARSDNINEELIQAIGIRLRDYTRLSTKSRAESLQGLWQRVVRETGAPALSPPSPAGTPPPKKQPPKTNASRSAPDKQLQSIPQKEPPSSPVAEPPAALNAPVTVLNNVGPRHAQTLGRLGLHTLEDMLFYFPRRYDDYSKLKPINRLWYGEVVTVIGSVKSVSVRSIRGGKAKLVEAVITDGTGAIRASWFNQPWQAKRLRQGLQVALSGKIDQYLGRLVMNNPEWESLEQQQLNTNRIVPVYPLTANITQRWLRRMMNQVVTYWSVRVPDPLPDSIRQEANLMDISKALLQAHFPDSEAKLQAARHRLAFDEIFYLQLGVLRQKRAWEERNARTFQVSDEWLHGFIKRLPFALTSAQERAIADIRSDLASGKPLNRLLQGDVGSGKTVVAAMGVAAIVSQGAQAAIMAPTSILAEQHYRNLRNILVDEQPPGTARPILQENELRLMVGATKESKKKEIRQALEDGSVKLVIGTHALLEDPVKFADLEMVVVDEQHRFGVKQRAALRDKGTNPHLLVMTATPIPRSLALTVYGDLDLSVMDEMPPGRQAVDTHLLAPQERERAYSLICSQVEKGHQAFIIYPLVEESEKSQRKAAVEEHARLQKEIFPRFKLGLLHGRLKAEEKDRVMRSFKEGEYQILVSTSVVEVGVDIPNATVMVIEGADRFGLAQLHQFRGRVGRGGDKAYCLLIPENSDAVENERLQAMTETNDGFVLAERDLEQRGPGEFLGTRQSGYGQLRLASLTDVRLIEKARRFAQKLFAEDPELAQPMHQLLLEAVNRFWNPGSGDVS